MEPFSQNLEALFNPESVAVVGASDKPDKLGFHVMKSLSHGKVSRKDHSRESQGNGYQRE